jgi:hypothetical protein
MVVLVYGRPISVVVREERWRRQLKEGEGESASVLGYQKNE